MSQSSCVLKGRHFFSRDPVGKYALVERGIFLDNQTISLSAALKGTSGACPLLQLSSF